MIFYDYWRSSSAWRVRIALHWKGLRFERRAVNLFEGEQYQPAFQAINPMRQVPVLVIDDGAPLTLTQSQAILSYLDERFPTPPLLPSALAPRARARQRAEMMISGIQPLHNLGFLKQLERSGVEEPWAIARQYIGRGLTALETVALDTAGTFLIGGEPSLADVCLVPQLYSARRFGVDLSPYPTLTRVEAACAALPAFVAAHADAQTDARAGT